MFHSWRNLHRVSRSAHGSLTMARNMAAAKGEKKYSRPNRRRRLPPRTNRSSTSSYAVRGEESAITSGADRADRTKGEENPREILVSHPDYHVSPASIIDYTTHRDGAIYQRNYGYYRIHRVTDRGETRLEPATLSEPADCFPDRETCTTHHSTSMMQIFSLKLAKAPPANSTGSVQLYGYIAVRDCRDYLLNYVFSRSRDDPLAVREGSPIEMTGPRRGVSMMASALVEFDVRIKNGEGEEDDLQLIDGATGYSELVTPLCPFTQRIGGDCGAVDITLVLLRCAVEATIDVVVSEVESGLFDLSLSSFVFVDGLHEVPLFRGTIGEPRGLGRYVIAVKMDTWMHLRFRVGQKGSTSDDLEHWCSFEASTHGCACRHVMLERGSVSIKVTWSTVPVFS